MRAKTFKKQNICPVNVFFPYQCAMPRTFLCDCQGHSKSLKYNGKGPECNYVNTCNMCVRAVKRVELH